MNLAFPFILGFSAAAVGTLLPGLLNMTAAKISMYDGKKRAFWFAFGAALVLFFQALLAVFFARFIDRRTDISDGLQEIGFCLFTLITVYFLWLAKKPKTKNRKETIKLRSRTSGFFMGILLSVLNVFPVPYYVFLSITLASYHYFSFETYFIYTFSFGASLAAFLVFWGYVRLFKNRNPEDSFISKNINYIIGSITGIIALITLLKILNR